jgi:hypothetical protein
VTSGSGRYAERLVGSSARSANFWIFPEAVTGNWSTKRPDAGHLVRGEPGAAELGQVLVAQADSGVGPDEGGDLLAPVGVRNAHHRQVLHAGMGEQHVLDFWGKMFSPPRMIISFSRPSMRQ